MKLDHVAIWAVDIERMRTFQLRGKSGLMACLYGPDDSRSIVEAHGGCKVNVGQTVPEQLRLDLDVERTAIKALNTAVELCRSLDDNGSREMLEDILHAEEEHANWIEAQLTLIAQAGEANYLAQQIRDDA